MKSVYLAVGHGETPSGSHDPGASANGWTEQKAMDILVSTAAAALRKDGRLKVYDEAYKKDPNYVGTVKAANAKNVSVLVECHQDWSGGIREMFGFWFPGSKEGERLTRTILASYKAGKRKVNQSWTKPRRDLYVLRNSRMPATLLEHGRVGDTWVTEGSLEELGLSAARGILEYFGMSIPKNLSPIDTSLPKVPEKPVKVVGKYPPFPLPKGHWFGTPRTNPRNHSGFYWAADRKGIREAQEQLRKRGWTIFVDGYFGPKTASVVKKFQRNKGLRVDGLLGPETWKALWLLP